MKNKFKAIFFLGFVASLLISCSSKEIPYDLVISGDVDSWLDVDEIWNELNKSSFEFAGDRNKGVEMQSLIELCGTEGDYDVYIKASDGFMVKLDGETITDTYILYSNKLGFCYISEKHPVNSRVKFINEIIVKRNYGENEIPNLGIHVLTQSGDIHVSIGELLIGGYEIIAYEDGVSCLDEVSIEVMKQKKVVRLASLVDEEIDSILLMDEEGSNRYVYADNFFIEIDYNRINLFTNDKSEYYRNVEGIIVNPPATSVMNAYYDSKNYLENDEKVMLIFVDGLSYSQYENINENYTGLFLSNADEVKKATTVFKPVTNSGFAAMITGEPPIENGILNRDYREVKVDTIFDLIKDMGKASLLVEGEVKILNTNSELILNIDSNNDGYTDDEVYASAINIMNNGYDYILIHFHGVDDAGHDFGPYGEQTFDKIKEIDRYIKELVSSWDGKVIIVSDHGMHNFLGCGDHGEFRSDDMFVPYMILSGGEYEK